jgi:hypothetical protein
MRSTHWLLLISGLLLAGCESRDIPVATIPAPAPAQEEALVPPPVKAPPAKLPAPMRKPQQPATDQAAGTGPGEPQLADAVPPPENLPPPVTEDIPTAPSSPGVDDVLLENPDQVIGLDLAQIARLLGEPVSRSEKPPAKVWNYVGQGCMMRIFVYPDIKSRVFRALTYEIQGTDGTPLAKRRCFTGLKKQHAA